MLGGIQARWERRMFMELRNRENVTCNLHDMAEGDDTPAGVKEDVWTKLPQIQCEHRVGLSLILLGIKLTNQLL